MLPVLVVGLAFKDQIEQLFSGNIVFVGFMLLVTGLLLLSTTWVKAKQQKLSFGKALLIGVAQAIAVLPGISRSGATISLALNLGVSREQAARFSFLMVLIPIIGAGLLQMKELGEKGMAQAEAMPLVMGFIGAFIAGLLACSWMLRIVKKGKIQYFAYYCFIVGAIAILVGWLA